MRVGSVITRLPICVADGNEQRAQPLWCQTTTGIFRDDYIAPSTDRCNDRRARRRATRARRVAAARTVADPRARQHGCDRRSGEPAQPAVLRRGTGGAGKYRTRGHARRIRGAEAASPHSYATLQVTWMRRQTLTASNAAPGAAFGQHIAIFNNRALIASRSAVYIFQLTVEQVAARSAGCRSAARCR